MRQTGLAILLLSSLVITLPIVVRGEGFTGEGPNLGPADRRITQEIIANGELPCHKIQKAGEKIFTTPYNKYDGYGDGPLKASGDLREGGFRPTLQNNGTFLRVNGLDGQTCLECHFIVKNSTIPAILGVGGVAGANANALFMPSFIDVAEQNPGQINGRFINPPFLFGSGGVELLGKEMTMALQRLKDEALRHPGDRIELITKGVHFGTIVADSAGNLNTSEVEGIDEDLVVRPFGRKGEFATVRGFDVGAMQFHFGMQPVEVVGKDVDEDGDGVSNEILVGELSALHIFNTTLDRPLPKNKNRMEMAGYGLFQEIGCAGCHIPVQHTKSEVLTYSFPEVDEDPMANVYYQVDLRKKAGFKKSYEGGIIVSLFSDLKRHDMGDGLAESFDIFSETFNRQFITARLWGLRDTAPYLHDGRALTITEAILMHGGEAESALENYKALSEVDKAHLLAFLYTLQVR